MTFYRLSKHVAQRAQQRGRRQNEVEFVLAHGTEVRGGIILSDKDAIEIERRARQEIAMANRLRGIYVPTKDDVATTIFKATPKQRSRLL